MQRLIVFAVLAVSCFAYRFTAEERQAIVDAHNWARDRIPIDFPEYAGATCLPHVEWDYYIEEVAQQYANTCPEDHSSSRNYEDGSHMGENLAWQSWVSVINYSTIAWYNEVQDYDPAEPGFSSATGHYTQVVWNETRRIGCGVAYGCRSWMTTFVCNYWPAGNVLGYPAWIPAKDLGLEPVNVCLAAASTTSVSLVLIVSALLAALLAL